MPKDKKTLLNFWEDQMRQSHTSSNYFFRKSPSHYHMMLLVMSAYKENKKLSVEQQIGRAHVRTPVTSLPRMPSSA